MSGQWANARQVRGSLRIPYYWCNVTSVKGEKRQYGLISLYFSVVIDSFQRTLALTTLHACHLCRRRWAKWELPLVSSWSTWCWKVGVATQGHIKCSYVTVSSEKMMKGKGGRKRSSGWVWPHPVILPPRWNISSPGPCTSSWSSLSSLWGSHGLSLVGRAVTGGGTFCGMPGVGSHQPHSLNNRV